DFASAAFPELQKRGWPATVFLPTAQVGGVADWDAHAAGRRLLSWATVAELARRGIDFGGHGVRHADLTALTPAAARDEIMHSKWLIAEHTGRPVPGFA